MHCERTSTTNVAFSPFSAFSSFSLGVKYRLNRVVVEEGGDGDGGGNVKRSQYTLNRDNDRFWRDFAGSLFPEV